MPTFTLVARDRADAGSLRADTRERHLDHLREAGADLLRAGPLLDEGGTPIGSLVMIEAADLAAARAFAAADPYAQAGLFASVDVVAWRHVLP